MNTKKQTKISSLLLILTIVIAVCLIILSGLSLGFAGIFSGQIFGEPNANEEALMGSQLFKISAIISLSFFLPLIIIFIVFFLIKQFYKKNTLLFFTPVVYIIALGALVKLILMAYTTKLLTIANSVGEGVSQLNGVVISSLVFALMMFLATFAWLGLSFGLLQVNKQDNNIAAENFKQDRQVAPDVNEVPLDPNKIPSYYQINIDEVKNRLNQINKMIFSSQEMQLPVAKELIKEKLQLEELLIMNLTA